MQRNLCPSILSHPTIYLVLRCIEAFPLLVISSLQCHVRVIPLNRAPDESCPALCGSILLAMAIRDNLPLLKQ